MSHGNLILPPIAPCGMCRQALLEEEIRQNAGIVVYLSGSDGQVMTVRSIAELLPFRFDGSILGN